MAMIDDYYAPSMVKQRREFTDSEQAWNFMTRCRLKGCVVLDTSFIASNSNMYVVEYFEPSNARAPEPHTVAQVVEANDIGSFQLKFLDNLGKAIENPNMNVLADLKVRKITIDYLSQKADITVITI